MIRRIDLRALLVACCCALLVVALAVYALLTGGASISVGEVLAAAVGRADPFVTMIVVEWRAPRVLIAVVLGAALALSGAIFQQLTNNPLGSPDVIGFQTGSFTGALVVMLLLHGSGTAVMVGALLGGLATALVVFALAMTNTVRLIIVGIGVSAMLASLNTWLMLSATVENAIMAGLWGAGNLAGSDWADLTLAAIGSGVLTVVACFLARPLRVAQIGIPFATALGQRVRLVQMAAIAVGIGLTAVSTATIGPVAFISLAAPQIARRLARTDGLDVLTTAAVGSALLLAADVVAQRVYPPSPLPVGIITTSIGGLYFLWLLLRERKGT
ncbi:iron chelate uptake ABC transporter family permease subunit [Corynebacterium sp. H128]|uniref:FecCD family ABC transporter permease n=1 Tax=Corynebacterium sp. H128 TaxID=3133427 RepID=UPI0030985E20